MSNKRRGRPAPPRQYAAARRVPLDLSTEDDAALRRVVIGFAERTGTTPSRRDSLVLRRLIQLADSDPTVIDELVALPD